MEEVVGRGEDLGNTVPYPHRYSINFTFKQEILGQRVFEPPLKLWSK